MSFTSTFHSTTQGTLENDSSISGPAKGVNIALHDVSAATPALVKVNDPSSKISSAINSTSHIANFSYMASYVKSSATATVISGPVKTNATYTLTYQ